MWDVLSRCIMSRSCFWPYNEPCEGTLVDILNYNLEQDEQDIESMEFGL